MFFTWEVTNAIGILWKEESGVDGWAEEFKTFSVG